MELTLDDVVRAAACLQIGEAEFREQFCRVDDGSVVLKDQDDPDQSCVFLTTDEKGLAGCRIHKAKPEQCAGFPFRWRSRDAVQFCDGLRALEGLPPASRRAMSVTAGSKKPGEENA